MKALAPALLVLILASPASAQKVIEKIGLAPALPPSAKWVGSDKPLRIEDMRGKVLLIHFWSVGSETCENNFKTFEQWAVKNGPADFRIIGVHCADFENKPEMADIVKEAKKNVKTFVTAIDETDLSQRAWKVDRVPLLFLVDKKGRLRYAWEGQLAYKRFRGDLLLETKIEELLAEK